MSRDALRNHMKGSERAFGPQLPARKGSQGVRVCIHGQAHEVTGDRSSTAYRLLLTFMHEAREGCRWQVEAVIALEFIQVS